MLLQTAEVTLTTQCLYYLILRLSESLLCIANTFFFFIFFFFSSRHSPSLAPLSQSSYSLFYYYVKSAKSFETKILFECCKSFPLQSCIFCYSLPLPLKQIRYLSADSDNVWNFLQAPLLCIYKIYKCLYCFVWRYLNHYKCLRFPRFVIAFWICKPLKSSRESYIYLLISLQLTALCNLSICFEFDWKWRYKYSNNNNKKNPCGISSADNTQQVVETFKRLRAFYFPPD